MTTKTKGLTQSAQLIWETAAAKIAEQLNNSVLLGFTKGWQVTPYTDKHIFGFEIQNASQSVLGFITCNHGIGIRLKMGAFNWQEVEAFGECNNDEVFLEDERQEYWLSVRLLAKAGPFLIDNIQDFSNKFDSEQTAAFSALAVEVVSFINSKETVCEELLRLRKD